MTKTDEVIFWKYLNERTNISQKNKDQCTRWFPVFADLMKLAREDVLASYQPKLNANCPHKKNICDGCFAEAYQAGKFEKEKEIQKLKEDLKEYEFAKDWPKMITDRNAKIKKLRDVLKEIKDSEGSEEDDGWRSFYFLKEIAKKALGNSL